MPTDKEQLIGNDEQGTRESMHMHGLRIAGAINELIIITAIRSIIEESNMTQVEHNK